MLLGGQNRVLLEMLRASQQKKRLKKFKKSMFKKLKK
jgi:hypothetical protein